MYEQSDTNMAREFWIVFFLLAKLKSPLTHTQTHAQYMSIFNLGFFRLVNQYHHFDFVENVSLIIVGVNSVCKTDSGKKPT